MYNKNSSWYLNDKLSFTSWVKYLRADIPEDFIQFLIYSKENSKTLFKIYIYESIFKIYIYESIFKIYIYESITIIQLYLFILYFYY